ncbi:MAG: heliorhodopsin HeR [Candidatus Saccharibacteria bacterium]
MASTKKKRTTAKPKQAQTSVAKSAEITAAKAPAKTSDQAVATQTDKAKAPLFDLHQWNAWLAWIHAAQGVAILLFSASRLLPLSTTYLTPNPLVSGSVSLVPATHHVLDINLAWLVAIFFFISAIAHGVIASVYRNRYEADLARGINRVRWIEYGLSASVMLVAIGVLSGVYDVSTLILIFVLSLIMNLLGSAMETYNQGKPEPNWLAYGIGCIAGIAPWIVIAIYLVGANVYGSGHIPGFVYWIYGSMFLFFNCFAVNMYLQYKRKGKWADYMYGERVYMLLSLVAKTLLAWQVFAGILRP